VEGSNEMTFGLFHGIPQAEKSSHGISVILQSEQNNKGGKL
jgi:hypothetical protein